MNAIVADQDQILSRVHKAIETIKAGGMVIMVDDEDRENEGDLVIAADVITPAHINFLAKEARGLICLTLEPHLVDRLKLPMMGDSTKNIPMQGTAFTVSIEAREGVTTGISAADRAHTIRVAIKDDATPEDIVVPGHIFPLKARPGGILERAGHTEGSVDLAKLAGFKGAGVICEIMNDDGTMARMPDLEIFAEKHQIPIVAIADLIHYRLLKDSLVELVERYPIRTKHGTFDAALFRNHVDQTEHLALIKGKNFEDEVVDVRVHSQRALIDAISHPERSGFRLDYGLKLLERVQHGVFLYLTHTQASLVEDLRVMAQDLEPLQTSQEAARSGMDLRLHGMGAQMLRNLGVKHMRIHTTSPIALKGLSGFGLEIVDTQLVK
ncbi:MAG: 3,4-dihydroxy-2-butanone-4-phosphate synthase [Oligoflexus sp.]